MAAAGSSSTTTKTSADDTKPSETQKEQQKPAAALEEDDEFEDFPVEGRYTLPSGCRMLGRLSTRASFKGLGADAVRITLDWPQEDAEVPGGNTHLWEESWDDNDTSEDFSKQLK